MATLRGFSFVLLAAAMFALVVAKSEMKMGKSLVKISDSGEMEFRRGGLGNASEDAHPIKIKMDEIMQVDNNGTELTDCAEASNSSKPGMGWINNVLKKTAMKIKMRRFRDFAKQNFNFEAKRSKVAMRHAMKSVKAAVQKFQTSLPDGIGKITIELALPEEDGDIDIDGEKQKLKIGDMKFNIEMSEWTWCDNAAFLDVYMKLASKKKPTKRQARSKSLPVSYDLGGNKTVSFSGKYQVDSDTWFDMEDGFPKVDPTDATRIVVRFPRFDQTLVYDPTVSGEDDADTSAASGLSSLSATLIAMATTVVCATLK